MQGKTHAVCGAVAAMAYVLVVQEPAIEIAAAYMIGGMLGGLCPDIDHPHSQIAKQSIATGVTSRACYSLFGHRGFVHSIWACILFGVLAYYGFGALDRLLVPDLTIYIQPFAIGIFLGSISHLFADSFNPTGVNWIPPITQKKHRFTRIKTGSSGETTFRSIASTLLVATLAWYIMHVADTTATIRNILDAVERSIEQ